MLAVDAREFRRALSAFATGVTIITTHDDDGHPVGVTASSFNSVSMDPPLVLWSLARSAFAARIFEASGHFAVHVLACDQADLATKFARSGEDKFRGEHWSAGQLGSPILERYAALFECSTRHAYEGGDHVIFVGNVERFERRDESCLLFHNGTFARSGSFPEDA